MSWHVEYTDQFGQWWDTLSAETQADIDARVMLLAERGPMLSGGVVKMVVTSRHPTMRELRCPNAIRVLFAWDPATAAILLLGGSKSPNESSSPNWNAWYEQYVPMADDLYDEHLGALPEENDE